MCDVVVITNSWWVDLLLQGYLTFSQTFILKVNHKSSEITQWTVATE
jgi:hypothetical protein